jgi:formyl-CoA transferase
MAEGALSDITVLETGQLIAGPFCGQMLGDFGRHRDQGGGPARRRSPAPLGADEGRPVDVVADARPEQAIGDPEPAPPGGQALAREIAAKADVMIENFRPGTVEKWGLGYDTLSALNPGLVMVRVSGYGQTGPYRDRAGFGAIGEAIGGIRHVTGYPDRPPSRSGVSIGDSLTGLFATIGALTALHARSRTGRGQVVDVALYESVLAVMEGLISNYDLEGYVQPRTGAILAGVAPS